MSNPIIPFPKNAEQFMRKAQEAMVASDYFEALDAMKKAIASAPQFQELHVLYVTLLCEQQWYDDAEQFILQHYPAIESEQADETMEQLFAQALIETWQLERAQHYLAHKRTYRDSLWVDMLTNRAAEQQTAYEQAVQEEREQIISQLSELLVQERTPFYKQQSLLPQLRQLTHEQWCEHVLPLLVASDNQWHPVLKAYVLEQCLERQLTGEVAMMIAGVQHQIVLAELVPLLQHPVIAEGERYMNTRYAQQPQHITPMMQHWVTFCATHYPLLDGLQEWLDAFCQLMTDGGTDDALKQPVFARFDAHIRLMDDGL